jgi:hypothetical protein
MASSLLAGHVVMLKAAAARQIQPGRLRSEKAATHGARELLTVQSLTMDQWTHNLVPRNLEPLA